MLRAMAEFEDQSGEIIIPFSGVPDASGAVICTLGYNSQSGNLTGNELSDLVDNRCQNFAGLLNSAVTVGPLRSRFQDAENIVETEGATTVDGTLTGDTIPTNCALLVRKHTLLSGRANRGRCFLPGINETRLADANHFATAAVDEAVEIFDEIEVGLGIFLMGAVIHHRATLTFTGITSYSGATLLATQRTRLRD